MEKGARGKLSEEEVTAQRKAQYQSWLKEPIARQKLEGYRLDKLTEDQQVIFAGLPRQYSEMSYDAWKKLVGKLAQELGMNTMVLAQAAEDLAHLTETYITRNGTDPLIQEGQHHKGLSHPQSWQDNSA